MNDEISSDATQPEPEPELAAELEVTLTKHLEEKPEADVEEAEKGLPGAKGARPARLRRRRRVSYLTQNKISLLDYKDVNLLKRFLNEQGMILPARQTGNTAKQQRMVARAVRRAREMALLPFTTLEVVAPDRSYRAESRPRRTAAQRTPEPTEAPAESSAEAPAE